MLLEEEMRRALEYCWWRARWWVGQGNKRHTFNKSLDEGLRAFTLQQAESERQRAFQWERQWHAVRAHASAIIINHLESRDSAICSIPDLVVELTLPEQDEDIYDDIEEM